MLVKPKGSTPGIWKPAAGHDPDPAVFIAQYHNLFIAKLSPSRLNFPTKILYEFLVSSIRGSPAFSAILTIYLATTTMLGGPYKPFKAHVITTSFPL